MKTQVIQGLALLLSLSMSMAWAGEFAEAASIRALISQTYDTAEQKVVTAPIVLAAPYALADWVQGERGGRALLKQSKGKWEIVLCAGDGIRTAAGLVGVGVPKPQAEALAKQLSAAESALPASEVRRFGIFGTEADPKMNSKHHHH